MKRIMVILTAFLVTTLMGGSWALAGEGSGSSPDNPIVVSNPSDVPNGAVEDEESTYVTDAKCDSTRSWVLTVPAVDQVTHPEYRYLRNVPQSHLEWGTEERTRTYTPAQEEISHQEYRYEREVPTYGDVIEKEVKGVVQTKVQGQWVNTGTFDWIDWPGAGPLNDDGRDRGPGAHNSIFDQTGNSNGSTRKVSTQYRYVVVGQFVNGSTTETTDWLLEPPAGDGWTQVDERKVIDQEYIPASYGEWTEWVTRTEGELSEPTLPQDTDVHQYRVVGPETVSDPTRTEYYVVDSQPSLNRDAASWVLGSPGEGWEQFDERVVVDVEASPEVVTYYAYSDGEKCDKPDKPDEPNKPQEPVEELPHTGATPALAGIAVGLLATGIAMLWFARRRLTD